MPAAWRQQRMRRERLVALAACGVGAALVLLAAGRPWVTAMVEAAPSLPRVEEAVSGADLARPLAPLGLVGLAAVAALLGARGRGRALVGALVVGVGVGVVASAWAGAAAPPDLSGNPVAITRSGWPWVAGVGGVLVLVGGGLALARGSVWPALGGRYDPPDASADTSSETSPDVRRGTGASTSRGTRQDSTSRGTRQDSLWDALDRGDDPTR